MKNSAFQTADNSTNKGAIALTHNFAAITRLTGVSGTLNYS